MDQQLKQRLIGVTIAVALVVIFVPMLFEKSDDKGKSSLAGIPAIPDDVLEKPLELPKTAEDLAPKEEEKTKAKTPAESGYRIVPLNDEPAPKPATPKKAAAPGTKTAQGEDVEAEEEGEAAPSGGEEDDEAGAAAPAAKPEPSAAKATPPGPAKAAAKPEAPKPPVSHLAEPTKPSAAHPAGAAHEPAKPAAKTTDAAAKKADPAGKSATAKSAEPRPTAIKTVKVNKPKTAAQAHDTDEAEVPIPAPAKPKPTAAQPGKKPETAKPATAAQPTAKTDKAAAPAKTAAKPAEAGGAAKPTAPKKSWAVQAGSFTDEAAAKGLADKLKQSKFPASVHAAKGANGTVYRVQVGAEQDRSRAEETLKKIQGSTGVSGVITPHH